MYIPKNRIITNLYSNQNGLVYKTNKKPYTGYYWKSYDGKIFTGKNPNDLPTQELEIIPSPIDEPNKLNNTSQIAFQDSPLDDQTLIINYTKLKNINIQQSIPLNLPTLYFPTPTPSDYKLGVFTRYFVVKINEIRYLEVNDATYQKIYNHSLDWAWEAYTPFTLPWTLIGVKEEVYNTNRNIVLLTEQRIKKQGLSQFLKENYTKFWIP